MIECKVVLDEGAYMPERAHDADAGWDLRSRAEVLIPAHGYAFFDTGVRMDIPKGYAGDLEAKSGLNVKHHIVGTGLIDSGYRGTIGVKLYNFGDDPYLVLPGDKIIQIVIEPIPEVKMTQVDALDQTERNEGGFGSTGR